MIPPLQSNVDTGGGDMVGVAVGGSHNRVQGTKTVVQAPAGPSPTVAEVMERLAELERAVEAAGLSGDLRDDALADVRTAREALSRGQPAVGRARNALTGTLDGLKAGGRAEAVTSVATLVTAVLDMLSRLAG
jgi:hypothetical protein